jgi:hypothetical protein
MFLDFYQKPKTMNRKEYLKQYLKEWRASNKQSVKEYQAKYFQENKQTILLKRAENEEKTNYHSTYVDSTRRTCCCGKDYKLNYYYSHQKKCVSYQKTLEKVEV